MEKEVEKKFVWVIKNLSSLQSDNLYSDPFVIGGCKWHLLAITLGMKAENFSLCLGVAYPESLPRGWKIHVKYRLSIVNQLSEKLSIHKEREQWLGERPLSQWGFPFRLPFAKFHAKDEGFIVNGELMVVAEIDVLQVIGNLDVSEETSPVEEKINFHGFKALSSQLESVRRIFERHPDIKTEVCTKNQYLQAAYLNVLLGVIETLCQPPQELDNDDLYEASASLSYMENLGFKLDWLKNKLNEVMENKNNADSTGARLREMEDELKLSKHRCSFQSRLVAHNEIMLHIYKAQLENLKLECSDAEALVEKETAMLGAIVPLSFDDVV